MQNLRGFDRIHLKPGETRTVTFTIEPDFLAIWNLQMKRVVEPGQFKVSVGASSTDIRLKGGFEIVP
jgi:beta-glucosidase